MATPRTKRVNPAANVALAPLDPEWLDRPLAISAWRELHVANHGAVVLELTRAYAAQILDVLEAPAYADEMVMLRLDIPVRLVLSAEIVEQARACLADALQAKPAPRRRARTGRAKGRKAKRP